MSVRAAILALFSLACAAPAVAQDRVIATERVDAWDTANLAWVAPRADGTVRVVVRGTLTNALDGSEIDGVRLATSQRAFATSMLVTPPGTRLVEERGLHEYVLDVPAGDGAAIALNVPALAARSLVTASELRASITGAIFVDVLAEPRAALVRAPEAQGLAGSTAGLSLAVGLSAAGLAVGAVFRRRQRSSEREASARARRAQRVIAKASRALGGGFDGARSSADALAESLVRQRAHLRALERAMASTAWVRSAEAAVEMGVLRTRHDVAIEQLDRIVARLEQAAVRMEACVADRAALAGLERDLAAMRVELEVGESVEDELAAIDRPRS